jgi:hypothetical protein
VELLLQDSRVDPSAEDNYAWRFASKWGYRNVAELLQEDDRVNPGMEVE